MGARIPCSPLFKKKEKGMKSSYPDLSGVEVGDKLTRFHLGVPVEILRVVRLTKTLVITEEEYGGFCHRRWHKQGGMGEGDTRYEINRVLPLEGHHIVQMRHNRKATRVAWMWDVDKFWGLHPDELDEVYQVVRKILSRKNT